MRCQLLIVVAALSASAAADAQVRTRCTSQDGLTIECETDNPRPAQPLDSYAKALEAAQRLVPDQQGGQLERAQIDQLRLHNEMMLRQLEREAAPGYDYKRCRRSAKAAIGAGDLALARDVLNACAGGH